MATMVRQNYNYKTSITSQSSTPTKIPVYLYNSPAPRNQLPSLRDLNTYQPKFSIAKVERVTSGRGSKRLDTRKHSDEILAKGKVLERSKLSSLSLEHINTSNVLYCVRDSFELAHVKMGETVGRAEAAAAAVGGESVPAASTLPRSYRQPVSKQVDIKQAKTKQSGGKSYAAMYAARRQHLDAQEQQKVKLARISKQRHENSRRYEQPGKEQTGGQGGLEEPGSSYPHTLPSAMYPHALRQNPLTAAGPLNFTHPSEMGDVVSRYFGGGEMGGPPPAPVLSPLPPIENSGDEEDENTSSSPKKVDSYSSPKPKITYKPYTLREYQSVRVGLGRKVGGLGPDTENAAYKEKLSKAKRMNEYARKLREQHRNAEFPKKQPKSKAPPPPQPSKAVLAMQYAKSIPPPRVSKPRQRSTSSNEEGATKGPAGLREEILEERVKRHFIHKRMMEDLDKL